MRGARSKGPGLCGWAWALFVSIALMVSLAGCAQLQKKFTRKKKEPARTKLPHFHPVKEFVKAPAPELYQKHYVFWQTWHSELLRVMGQNSKKDARCINEIISNLRDMENLLVPEKGAELAPHITKLEDVRDKIVEGNATMYNTTYIRRTLEGEERVIRNGFKYKQVKEYLKKES